MEKLVEFDRHRVLITDTTWDGWVSLENWIFINFVNRSKIFPPEYRDLVESSELQLFQFAIAQSPKGKKLRELDWIKGGSMTTDQLRNNWASPIAWLNTLLACNSGVKPECFAIVACPELDSESEDGNLPSGHIFSHLDIS